MLSESSNIVDDLIGKEDESNMNIDWRYYAFLIAITWFLLFRFRNPLQYYVKFTTYFIVTMVYSASIIPLALLRPNDCRNIK